MDFAFQEEELDDWWYYIDDGDRRAVPRSAYVRRIGQQQQPISFHKKFGFK